MLLAECADGRVVQRQPCGVKKIAWPLTLRGGRRQLSNRYRPRPRAARSLVVATGGLSIPKIGASDFWLPGRSAFGLPAGAVAPRLVLLDLRRRGPRPTRGWRPGPAGGDRHRAGRSARFSAEDSACSPGPVGAGGAAENMPLRDGAANRLGSTSRRHHLPAALAGQGALQEARRQRARHLVPSRLADAWADTDADCGAPHQRGQRDKALARLAAQPRALAAHAHRNRGLQKPGHAGRRGHAPCRSRPWSAQPARTGVGEVVDITALAAKLPAGLVQRPCAQAPPMTDRYRRKQVKQSLDAGR